MVCHAYTIRIRTSLVRVVLYILSIHIYTYYYLYLYCINTLLNVVPILYTLLIPEYTLLFESLPLDAARERGTPANQCPTNDFSPFLFPRSSNAKGRSSRTNLRRSLSQPLGINQLSPLMRTKTAGEHTPVRIIIAVSLRTIDFELSDVDHVFPFVSRPYRAYAVKPFSYRVRRSARSHVSNRRESADASRSKRRSFFVNQSDRRIVKIIARNAKGFFFFYAATDETIDLEEIGCGSAFAPRAVWVDFTRQ